MAQRLLTSGKLQRTLVALGVALQAYTNRLHTRPFHHETLSHGDGCRNGRDLRITADHRNEVGFGLPRWVWQNLADEAVQPQSDVCGRFLCALYVGKPTEAKVCVLHGDSFFSWVRI